MSNILISCDSKYYSQWGITLIKSIRRFAAWVKITVIIVNPEYVNEIFGVSYVYDFVEFPNEECKIPYYQAVRFLKCYDIFPNNELVMSLDCDSICTKTFDQKIFDNICKDIHVLKHPFKDRLLAGIVTYGDQLEFRKRLKEILLSVPLENWRYGRDQEVLGMLANEFKYKLLGDDWMSMGKEEYGIFYTLKGTQKNNDAYINRYKKINRSLYTTYGR